MKIVVTGGRDFLERSFIIETLSSLNPETIYVGDCPTGVDAVALEWAEAHEVPFRVFEADWKRFGRAAGPHRNEEMASAAAGMAFDFVLAFPGRDGTQDCVLRAQRRHLTVLKALLPATKGIA